MADPKTDAQESPDGEQDGTDDSGAETPFGDDPQELQGDDAGSGGS